MTQSIEDTLHKRIREAGLRLTLPRRAICKVLAANGESFLTAAEILAEATAEVGQIDSSTTYRALDDFARIGLVHHLHFGNQPDKWHLTLDHDHQHLVCETCGEPTLVPSSDITDFFDVLKHRFGFTVNAHHFAILGQCESCSAAAAHPDHSPTSAP
jgi:Fur family ferric uptake transcriptional regulator